MQEYLTIREAAKRCSLSEYRLRRMTAEGRVPGFKAGSRFYVNIDLLGEMLAAESRKSAGADTGHDDSATLTATGVVPHECPFCEAGQRLPLANERYGVSLVSSGGVVLHRTSGSAFLKYDNSEGRSSPGYAAISYCPKCGRKLT